MRVLVTGGFGFTGDYINQALSNDGHSVFLLESDLTDYDSLNKEINSINFNYVIHLAGLSHTTNSIDLDYYNVNTVGTSNLLRILLACKKQIKKILIASSAAVYGNNQLSLLSEKSLPNPMSHYGISKLAMEYLSLNTFNSLPIVVTRPFNYVGVGQSDSFVIPKIVNHFIKKKTYIELGNIDVSREFNDVRFVAKCYLRLLKLSKNGEIYNICSGKHYSLKFIIGSLSNITGHNLNILINKSLIRKNEINILYGSTKKLKNCIGDVEEININDTLRWMLYND